MARRGPLDPLRKPACSQQRPASRKLLASVAPPVLTNVTNSTTVTHVTLICCTAHSFDTGIFSKDGANRYLPVN